MISELQETQLMFRGLSDEEEEGEEVKEIPGGELEENEDGDDKEGVAGDELME